MEMREKILVSLRNSELSSDILNDEEAGIFHPPNPIVSNDGVISVMN